MQDDRILHHISFAVADLERSGAFYDAALAPLGCVRVWTAPDAIGYGRAGGGDRFAIKLTDDLVAPVHSRFHLAFGATSRAAIDAFFSSAVSQGGRDNGAPGLRAHYGPNYYAAFVIDPDGYPIEAVCKVAPRLAKSQ